MSPTRLTQLTNVLAAASMAADAASEMKRYAQSHRMKPSIIAQYRREFEEALEREALARRAVEAEYAMRHDLHVAEDGCVLCGARPYSLHSTEATDAEREWAATFSEDAARVLGVTA